MNDSGYKKKTNAQAKLIQLLFTLLFLVTYVRRRYDVIIRTCIDIITAIVMDQQYMMLIDVHSTMHIFYPTNYDYYTSHTGPLSCINQAAVQLSLPTQFQLPFLDGIKQGRHLFIAQSARPSCVKR